MSRGNRPGHVLATLLSLPAQEAPAFRPPQCPGHGQYRGRCDRDCEETVKHGMVYYAWACTSCASFEREARMAAERDHRDGWTHAAE